MRGSGRIELGSAVARASTDDRHDVTALTRRPEGHAGAGTPVAADIDDADRLRRALDGHDAAYYLVHSLADEDFAAKDCAGATAFPAAEGAVIAVTDDRRLPG